ncbi:hypothetical protein OAF27_00895 [Verrucomicrobiales bacterium]|nr:hypothetical protein [Verrucomicrobiales bacterium]
MNLFLATASRFYTHGFITILILGIIFTIVGILVGWFAWRHCRANAERIEEANRRLERQRNLISEDVVTLRNQISELEEAHR